MKMNRFAVAIALAMIISLGGAVGANAQDDSRDRNDRDANRTYEKETTDAQGRDHCSICGLTVEKAEGDQQGLKIVEIQRGGPADDAGLREGDILVSVDGQNLDSPDQLKKQMMQKERQSSQADVNVRIRRDDRNRRVTLTLDRANGMRSNRNQQSQSNRDNQSSADENRDSDSQDNANSNDRSRRDQQSRESRENRPENQSDNHSGADQASLGVTLDTNFQGQGQGVRIASVYTNSPAARAGLKTGDRILKVNDQSVSNAQEVMQRIRQMDPDESAELTIMADGEKEELDIQLTSRAETIQRAMVNRQGFGNNRFNRDYANRAGYSSAGNRMNSSFQNQSTAQFGSQNPVGESNESLTQALTGIRQELQQLRQQISRLENDNRSRGDNNSSNRDRDLSSQQNRYDDDRDDDQYRQRDGR